MQTVAGKYSTDREWSDQYIPEVKRLVGPHLLEPSPFVLDAERATDLIVLSARNLDIACRIRRPGYLPKFAGQFTIRSARDNGLKTELAKIIDGWGDWMFYAHAREGTLMFAGWWLLDLAVFRATCIRAPTAIRFTKQLNGDGTHFYAYRVDSFPPEFVVAKGGAA
jgi:hypothetical protein